MNPRLPASLSRLASVNPVLVDNDLGRSPEAQAELARILASEPVVHPRRARRWVPRRLLFIALPAMVFASGAALAATDPFGWWQSLNPNTAQYRADPSKVVRTPMVTEVRCARGINGFRCGAQLHGRPYVLVDRIPARPRDAFTRASIRRRVASALASGRISKQFAERVLADLAGVPDSFLALYNQAQVYGTYGGGTTGPNGVELAPPPGVPAFLACEPDGALLACQNLNGDTNAAIGSGVYQAVQTADWRPASLRRPDSQLFFMQHLTPAETQLLLDFIPRGSGTSGGTSTSSSSPSTTNSPSSSQR